MVCGVLCAAAVGRAQQEKSATEVGARCNVSVFGEKSTEKFLAFDRDLRKAIETRDVGKLALLTEFPLRVDDSGGAYFIHEGRSLAGHFDQIFTPEIRKAILSTTRDEIWCNYTGIAYGSDRVWINVTDKGFFVMTVNLPGNHAAAPRERTVEMSCSTDRLRILIDSDKNGVPRYRSWSKQRSLFDPPDLEIATGKGDIEGTGPCAHHLWSFHAGKAEIRLEEPGCYGDDDAPPEKAQAQLFVKADEKAEERASWCF